MSDNQNAIQTELDAFDNFENAKLAGAPDAGFTAGEIEVAKQDIADERELVASGVEGAEEAIDNAAGNIADDLSVLDDDEDGDDY